MALVNLRFEDPETAFVASQIANIIFNSLWFWSRALLLGCELRILLQMFLNLNPYFYPIYYVWQWTDPIFNFGRAWYPKLVGFDFTPMINFVLLAKVESFFDRKAHGVDKFNSWKYDQKKLLESGLIDNITTNSDQRPRKAGIDLPDFSSSIDNDLLVPQTCPPESIFDWISSHVLGIQDYMLCKQDYFEIPHVLDNMPSNFVELLF